MGVTNFSMKLIKKYLEGVKTVVELGAQNNYDQPDLPAPYMKEWFEERGIGYEAIDLSGENGSLRYDLGERLPSIVKHSLVTDFGTSEHIGKDGKHNIEAFYNCWVNKNSLLAVGGVMINENPKTGNWPGHGFQYYTIEFYQQLAKAVGYKILELGEHPAMGNTTDGWNIFCVFLKPNRHAFPSIEEFATFDFKLK